MFIETTHPAFSKCFVWNKLLNNCQKLSTFCGRIDKASKAIAKSEPGEEKEFYDFDDDLDGQNAASKFKGEIFEAFTELLMKLSPIDDRVGVHSYQIITEGDTGVDGFGFDRDDKPVAVQIKYRMWDYQLNYDREHLNNFRTTAYEKFVVDPDWRDNLLIITAGKDVHWRTLNKQFRGKVRCINHNSSYRCIKGADTSTIDSLFSLKTMVDGNSFFWKTLRQQSS